ncbi:MAG: hypothetical protein NUV86_06220 [Candidatus Scalindua sp.]|nr:hypothetical protein [Candidatus Scalindua sp.]MCR4343306.1 hypothetical protein [Candidatus Scalindua sp.]
MFKSSRIIYTAVACICIIGLAYPDVYAAKYVNRDLSFEVPGGWHEIKGMGLKGVEAAFTKEIDSEITPIMLIAIDSRVGDSTLKDVVEKAMSVVTSTIPDAKFLFERDVYTGNVKWREIIYQYSDAGYAFQAVQSHTIDNKKHFVFTGQSLQSDFREYLPEFRKTFDTWQFKTD